MKRISIFLTFLISAVFGLTAEQLTTVAIVDINKVFNAYFKDSQAVRELERQKQKSQEEINAYQENLRKLQDQRVQAQQRNDGAEVLRLEKDISELQSFIPEYRKLKQNQLVQMQQNLTQSDTFLNELSSAIRFVSESEGFSVVIDSDNPYLRYWNPEVDITEKVLERLRKANPR